MKRVFDLCFAILLILILSPIFFFVFVMLLILNRTNPVFIQKRPGLNGSTFTLYKFKSMSDAKDENGMLLPDDLRITYIGNLLRSLSIDELPQLFNVLKGDMSFVGPRPLLIDYLPLYNIMQNRRHEVKPGITGWAQVNGRNTITWQDKFKLDVWYVENQSVLLDVKILLLTILKVIKKDGISSETSSTMEKFTGN